MSNLYRGTFYRFFLPSFQFLSPSGFQRRRFLKNQQYLYRDNCIMNTNISIFKQELCFLLTSFGSFRNQPIRNKNCLWWQCLLMDRDEMSTLYRGTFHRCFLPSFRFIWQKRFSEEKIFLKYANQKTRMACGAPCLLMDRDEMSNLYRGLSIDGSYQVSVHLAEGVLEAYLSVIQFIEITAF